jgi:hypothetical protein
MVRRLDPSAAAAPVQRRFGADAHRRRRDHGGSLVRVARCRLAYPLWGTWRRKMEGRNGDTEGTRGRADVTVKGRHRRGHAAATEVSTPVVTSKRTTAPVGRVLTLTVIDQGASSVSNFALAIIVAHYSDAKSLGVFALLTVTYILSQGLVRSMTSDCMLTRSETDDTVMSRFERAGYLSAFLTSVALSLLVLAVSPFLPHDFSIPFVIFAVCFPFMALQDFSRFIGISRHDPAYSIRLDVAWVVIFLVAFVLLKSADMASLNWLWGAWTGAGAVVGLYTMRWHLARRGKDALLRFWVESEKAVALRFAGNFMLTASWLYFIFYLLVFVISIEAVGQIKLAQLALGPILVLATGVQTAMISIVAKRFRVNVRKALLFCFFAGLATASLTAAWTALIYFLPVQRATQLFGPVWPQARQILPIVGLSFVLGGFSGIATAGLRAIRAATANLWLAVAMLPLSFIPCVGGAALWGAAGFCWGLAFAFASYAVLGWIILLKQAHRYRDEEHQEPTVDPILDPSDPNLALEPNG